jgi:asparagine synthase (glutamine-hydrolysing)
MGQKPLYVATPYCSSKAPAIAFGSELAALRQVPWFRSELNPSAVREYLRWGHVGNESTIYNDEGKLAPGMWQAFCGGVRTGDYYYHPNETCAPADDPVRRTRELVGNAVRRQLVSDVPLGCLLSGGIDSSVVAAAARRAIPDEQPLLTFSISFDDPRYDEGRYAEQVARHLGTKHHRFTVQPEAAADLPALAEVYGEPFGDSSALPVHYLSRETRKHVKVALSGDGGDELFGGYDRYRAMRLGRHLHRIPAVLRSAVARTTAPTMAAGHPKSRVARVGRFLGSLDQPAASRYAGYLRLFSDELIAELFGDVPAAPDQVAAQYESLSQTLDPVQAALATDRLIYLPDDLLTKLDRASMLHALEVRSPFMDHELVQFAASLTTDQLLKGGPKRMLREAFAQDLPAWVFRRKKMGFAVPIGDWFRGELRPMLRDHLFAANSFASTHFNRPVVERLVDEHERQWADHSQRLYALLMLELWWRL